MDYKDRTSLKQKYDELGSTRQVGKFFGVSNGTIIYWMKKYGLKRVPKLYLFGNNSGKGRLGELYILGHPYFKKEVVDMESIDDKYAVDLIWRNNRVNVKTSHFSRPLFRVKVKRHKASFYICLYFIDPISSLIPREIWIVPASVAPHSGISPSLTKASSVYHKYKLSLLRNKKFTKKKEDLYNKWFIKKYSKITNQRKRGEKK